MLLFVGVHDAGSARFVAGRVMPGRSSARFACMRSRQRGKNAYRIGCRPAFPATIRAFSPRRSPTARSAQAAAIAKPTKLEGPDGTIAQPSIESRERGLPGFARAASAQACMPRQSPAQTRRFNSGTTAIGKMKRHCRLFIHRISEFQYPPSLNRIIYRLNE